MSEKLYLLGKWAFSHRRRVVTAWVIVLAIMGILMANFQEAPSTEISIPGTESIETINKLGDTFPSATGQSGRIVFAAPEGQLLTEYEAIINTTLAAVSEVEHVTSAVSPLETKAVSEDGRIGLSQVQFDVSNPTDITEEMSSEITDALTIAGNAGLQAEASTALLGQAEGELVGIGEAIGVAIAAIVLIVTLGSLVAAGLPLLAAFLSVLIGLTAVFSLSSIVDVNSTTPILAIMLGLAVGIDYALFIVVKYRKYVMQGVGLKEAAGRSIATAGNAVIFAALTVMVALAGLSVVGIPFLTAMGLSAALTVFIAALVNITFTPAMLGFIGQKVLNKKRRATLRTNQMEHPEGIKEDQNTFVFRWARKITARPLIPLAISVMALVIVAIPAASITIGNPGDNTAEPETTQRKAYDLVSDGFGPGFSGPLLVVADLPSGSTPEQSKELLSQAALSISGLDNVVQSIPAQVSEDGKTGLIQVTPATGPSESKTKDLVKTIRDNRTELANNANVTLSVTGETAIGIDIDQKLQKALPVYIVVVVGLSLLILIVVFRSILVPIKATLGFLLTIAATAGATVALFQWGWFGLFAFTPVVSFLPIILVGILFGLAMDYEFFLVSGMHESFAANESHPKDAVIEGFAHGAPVVTAAAVIMVSVFSGFITSGESLIQMLGFALAFGILIDAFIVRMTIVPALMALMGKSAWWLPKWLDKILPDLAIEGDESVYEKTHRETVTTAKK